MLNLRYQWIIDITSFILIYLELFNEMLSICFQIFADSGLNLDTSSFQNLSTSSCLDASSSLNISNVMEASIHEPIEISILTDELKEEEMRLKETKCKLAEDEFQLQEIQNQNLLAQNELKNFRHEYQTLKEDFKEEEEDLIMINAEMSLLPKLKQADKSKQNSIYDELVRDMETIKIELSDKKKTLSHYVNVLHQIEAECKHIEIFADSGLNLDTSSFQNLSTSSCLDASSSLNISNVMEASIHEPIEISILTDELKEEEMRLKETKCKLAEDEFQLQEIQNQNLLAQNELKNFRHEYQTLKEDFKTN
ncbi:spindle pole body component 110-like [Diaphorina citri]|uniref:Spindle pole body component 110-like n=1 Tax=Diaphorina citri TaxID=121845 RepID=A0A1S3D494_DIACI|nr:spindle pole body component 110-like [Diaphorina citri]